MSATNIARREQDETDGNAGFLRAARDGNLDEVLDYLKGSTDINTSNPNGLNALHLASKEGHINIVTELLSRGANVEAATKKGNTALHIASLAGHEEIVRKLVENGAQVNLQAQAGFTPLYMASQEGHADVVKFLLSVGANQGLSTEDGFTPLAVALQQGHDKVVSVLLEHDAKGKVRLPALHIAAKKDDVKSAALLLQNEQNSVELQTKSGFTPLHIAAHYGNINVANLLIQRNADVNFRAKNNITPLHVASRWGKLNMVNLLLDNNATIDEKTRDGLTPLHCASRSGHESVVDTLLEKGAPHSAKTKNGLTPLHMAAQGDHEDCARLLLYHKASLNEVTVDYLTPLHVAAHCGNVKTAKLLLDRKCEPNARALNGFTPLHIACKKNRIKVVELLLKYGASIESKTESGLTPLHVASFMGHMNIVIYLIQHNANPNTATVRGETSLHLAARANQSDIIRILLRNSATVDARAREQQTPLHIAARLGNVDNVLLLLQHGASVDATTKDKYTPLHIAAKEGHEEVAQVLLEHEAQHDITTKKGFTPLHIAAKYGNIKVARLLLQKEANPDISGKNGLTPLHVATHYNHANVAQLLLENKANPHATAKNGYTPLHIAAKKNQMDIATMLLEYGAKPDAESKNGFTPLHLAAQEGHTDIVSLLLEKQANVNATATNGLTPMHLAAQEDRVQVAEILVKHDSATDTSTKAGYTPLHTACHFGQVNMVRFLLDHEASVNATTKVGYTPLHQAAQQGHVQVVNTLLKNQASPNAVTNNGQTPLAIAQRLGYISVVEILKPVTEVQGITPSTEDKYKVVSPETMQETFISDSEDEGDDFMPQSPIFGKPLSEQHVYLPYYEGQKIHNREDSISLERGGSASPLDTSFDKQAAGDKSRTDSVFYSGDYSTLGSNQDSLTLEGTRDRSVGDSTGDFMEEDDLKYVVADEAYLKKDYMDAQITSQSFSAMHTAAPPITGRLPVTGEVNRFSSYSGSSFSTSFDPDNVLVDRSPVYAGFLISFMVDARGGAMRGCRHPGVRVIIPPRKCCMPTRITCRLVKKEKLTKPPPMLEGEGLAARVLEMGPAGTKFLGPILLEVPHFASLRGKEREVVILRSDNGETWYEHPTQATEDAVAEALGSSAEELDSEEDLSTKRIKRILTTDLPMYFALVSRVTRVKQESTVIGTEGGVLSSNVVPQVQAVFPEGTLRRPIPVGLQAQPIAPELVAKLLGNRVAVSPIVTIEPRRRQFHKPITLTIPVPKAAQKGMINQYGGERPTLRLLFSLAADPNPAVWEDVTDSKPMTLVDDCVSFTTKVSARFWLIDCQNVAEAAQMASILYQEAVTVPYMAKFVVFAKRDSPEEGKLRIFCMTDDKDDKTLEKQEKFYEVARSRDIEVLEGRPQFVEMAGNLIPVTKSGDQLHVNFRAFRENRLPCTVKIRDQDQEPSARVAFMKEPKVARGEAPQTPICNLNIRLPDMVLSDSGELDPDKSAEIRKRHEFLRGQGFVIQDTVNRAEMKLSDIADTVQGDWVMLAQQLHISISDINHFKNDYKTVGDQALAMLHFWLQKNGDKATGNELENALRRINRDDVVRKCMYNIERVEDEAEVEVARAIIEQTGLDSKDSLKRGMSLDVQYDEQDMIKESESAGQSPAAVKEQIVLERRPPPTPTIAEVNDVEERFDADEEEVQTPPPSPTEKLDSEEKSEDELQQEVTEIVETYRVSEDGRTWKTIKKTTIITVQGTTETVEVLKEEPVTAAESSIAEAATRLESEAANQIDSEGKHVSIGQVKVQHEFMYSRAEIVTDEEPTQEKKVSPSLPEVYGDIVSPVSEGGSSYIDEPSPVPEPTLPEDFRADELDYEKIEDDDERSAIDDGVKCESAEEVPGDISSERDFFETPEQSFDKSDKLASSSVDAEYKDNYEDEADEQEIRDSEDAGPDYEPDEFKECDAGGFEEGDRDEESLVKTTPVTEGQDDYVDRLEETLECRKVIIVQERTEVIVDDVSILTVEAGDTYVDRSEETLECQKITVKRGQTPDRPVGFQVAYTSNNELIAATLVDDQESLEVSGDHYSPGETYTEEVRPDGTIVRHRKIRTTKEGSSVDMEEFCEETPAKEETEVEDHEEIMADGTVHTTHTVRRHSFKKVKKHLKSVDGDEKEEEITEVIPGSEKKEIIETFDEPPRMVHEEEEMDEVLDDGTKVHRKIILNRMVHRIRTHQESFDSDHGRHVEDYEIDEIIPGTESAFLADPDSDSSSSEYDEHEVEKIQEKTEILDDGTIVKSKLLTTESTHKTRSRTGSIDETEIERIVEEESITPSPRPRSPVDADPYDVTGKQPVKTITKTSHIEESVKDDVVERTLEVVEDMIATGALKSSEDDSDATVAESFKAPTVEVQYEGEGNQYQEGDDQYSSGAHGDDDDVQTHRLMMKKEVHKKTTIGLDGQEHTTIREDSQVQQDNEPPEELRESMQEIINQFMESDPQPAHLLPAESKEDEV